MTAPDATFGELDGLGWGEPFATSFAEHAATGRVPGRVVAEADPGRWPAVGDWVALDVRSDGGTIQGVLPRRSAFSRLAAGRETRQQVVAANVDVVFIVTSLNRDF